MFSLQKAVKFTHLISKEAVNNKCYAKCVFSKVFKKLYRTIKEPISSNVADLFYSRALGPSKGTRGYSGTQKNTRETFGHYKDTQSAPEHSDTRPIVTLGQLGFRGTRGILFRRFRTYVWLTTAL